MFKVIFFLWGKCTRYRGRTRLDVKRGSANRKRADCEPAEMDLFSEAKKKTPRLLIYTAEKIIDIRLSVYLSVCLCEQELPSNATEFDGNCCKRWEIQSLFNGLQFSISSKEICPQTNK